MRLHAEAAAAPAAVAAAAVAAGGPPPEVARDLELAAETLKRRKERGELETTAVPKGHSAYSLASVLEERKDNKQRLFVCLVCDSKLSFGATRTTC